MLEETFEVFSPEEKLEAKIHAEAERTINATLTRHGISRDRLSQGAIDDAVATARATVTAQQELSDNPYHAMYCEEVAKREQLESQLKVMQSSSARQSPSKATAQITAEQARASVGELQWNHRTSDADKLSLLGVDPASITRGELQKLFGRGADAREQLNFSRANPRRYATLRECAKALAVYGS